MKQKDFREVEVEIDVFEFMLLENLRDTYYHMLPPETQEKVQELIEYLENRVEMTFEHEDIEEITYKCKYLLSKKRK